MIKFSIKDINEVFNNKNAENIKNKDENIPDKKDIEKAIEKINEIFEIADKFFVDVDEWALPEYKFYINEFKKQFIKVLIAYR